jgi:Exonuclease
MNVPDYLVPMAPALRVLSDYDLTPRCSRARRHNAAERDMTDGTTPLIARDAAVIDTEITRLDPRKARIAELAVPRITGGRLDDASFSLPINPGEPIPPAATHLHGIDDAKCARLRGGSAGVFRMARRCAMRHRFRHASGILRGRAFGGFQVNT